MRDCLVTGIWREIQRVVYDTADSIWDLLEDASGEDNWIC